ncbi:Rib/alpha-like domain-containing protein [Corynebacterium urealyticum]|uniref:Rib/alpha-like domain-containing protein n=1 Tax=Corynebacterium urealyticum TaxID=43771 RepID=UPI0016535F42|nr:Rib/alpha-like domain-containing protein [Corynebacterium urealyticum]
MANLRGLIARGGKSGAFALGFSDKMKSVAGAMAVLALATTGTVVVQSQVAPAAQAAQDPVESPGEWLGQKTVNGKVFLDRDGNAAAAGSSDEPLAGVKVYAQWIDYNNKKQRGAVSPIYTAQTKADGTYSISLPDWTDALGTVHKWEATAGQKLRIWAENPDPKNLQVAFIEGDSVFGGQGDRYHGTWNGTVGIQLAENYNISYHERDAAKDGQDWLYLPEDKSTTGEKQVANGGRAKGRVYYDQRGTFGKTLFTNQYEKRYGDVAVPKVKIRGSYVQDEVARRFDKWADDNKGYTTEAFREAQKKIMAEYEAETGKSAIAETVVTETDNEGKYHLQFKGLWGNSYKAKGIMNAGEWGELATSSDEGSWATGNLNSKHINYEYMYVSPVLPEGVDANMDSSQSAMFQNIMRASMVHAVSGGGHAGNYINDLDFSLRQTSRGFDVTPYNTTDKPAAPGDTAKTDTFGLTPNTAHVIVWTDSEGNEVHRCEANSDNLGVIPSCDFTVPEDLATDTIYTATVYNAADESTPLMADSFLAYVVPEYKETEVKVGEEATAERPVNKNGTAVPASAKFAAATAEDVKNAPEFQKAGLPEDIAPQDWVTVNEDGTLTIKPGADVKPGTYNVPVKVTYEDGTTKVINAPIKVNDADAPADQPDWEDDSGKPGDKVEIPNTGGDVPEGTTVETDGPGTAEIDEDGNLVVDIDENANPGDKIVVVVKDEDGEVIDEVTVTVEDPGASADQPDWEDDSGKPGDKVEIPNTGGDVPEGTTVETDGPGTAEIDEDGNLVVDIDENANPGDKIVVVVKDEDDEVIDEVTVTVEEPGDKNADTYEPEYEDGSGNPGEDVTVPAPEFKDKDGEPTDAPDGTKFELGEDAPSGVTIDENTGEITVTIPEDAEPGTKIEVPVVVTYPDGSTDEVTVTVTVEDPNADTPGASDPQKYPEDTEVEQGGSEKITPITEVPEGHTPKLVDQDGNPADKVVVEDENGKITVEIDGDGVITVTPDENATPGDYKIPVVNVDENGDPIEGTDQQVPVKVTEKGGDQDDEGDNTGDDAVKYTPTWKNAKTKPAVPVDVPNERPDQLPEGSTVEAGSDKGWTVTTAPDGTITVTPPADAQHGDKSEIAVTVTYPDGSQDQETFTVTVETDPSWEDGKTTPSEPIVIPNDGGPVKPGTTVEVVDNGPGNVEIDENGNITVTPTDEAEPGDKVVVEVKDPEGNVIDTITVEITEDEKTSTNPNDEPKGNQADDVTPDWENETVKPGGSVEVPNKGDKLPDGSTIETEVSEDGWTVEVISENGDLKVTPPEGAKHGDKVTVTVTVTYPDGSTDTEKFTVTVVEEKDDQGGDGSGPGGDGSTPGGDGSTPGGDGSTPGGDGSTPGGDGSTPGGDGSGPGSSGSSDLPEGLIPGLIGGGIIGGIIGGNLGSSHGSSTPGHGAGSGHGAGKAPADKGAQGADKGAQQGGKGAGQSGTSQSGAQSAQSGASSSSAGRQGSLAVTGVSGVAIMLGAAAMALAIGGALLAGRRRREN